MDADSPLLEMISPDIPDGTNRLGLLGADVDVDFKVPQSVQLGLFHQINQRYSVTVDALWINMSEFGVTSVSAGPDHVSV